jgi:rhodanese-related sulfurtransferase
VPLADLPGQAGELAARRQPIVVVCKTDRRSARAATELLATGLRDVAFFVVEQTSGIDKGSLSNRIGVTRRQPACGRHSAHPPRPHG